MKEIKTVQEFIERVKNKESVSRYEFTLGFKWDMEASAVLRKVDLSYANLRSADLSYANLSSADLSYANLSSADLRYANLSSADLYSADLSSADLSYANLSSADLSYANLSSADLSYANLSSADLSSADLSSADLRSADLSSADLSYADFSLVCGVSFNTMFKDVKISQPNKERLFIEALSKLANEKDEPLKWLRSQLKGTTIAELKEAKKE